MKKYAGHEKMESKSATKIEILNQKDELAKEERESTDINQFASRGTSKLLNEHREAEDTITKEMEGGNKKGEVDKIDEIDNKHLLIDNIKSEEDSKKIGTNERNLGKKEMKEKESDSQRNKEEERTEIKSVKGQGPKKVLLEENSDIQKRHDWNLYLQM